MLRAEGDGHAPRRVVVLAAGPFAEYAGTHTVAELRGWLKRFVVRIEPDEALQRAEAADLLSAWLTTVEASQATWSADVAVIIEADVLTGITDGYTESSDGE